MADYTGMKFGTPFKQLYHKIFGDSDNGKQPQIVEPQNPEQSQGATDVLSQISNQGAYEIPADQIDGAQGQTGSALDEVGQGSSGQGWGSWLKKIAKQYAVPITMSAASGLPVYAFTGSAARALATAIFTGAVVPPVAKAAKSATQAVVDNVSKLANPEYKAPPELPRFDQNVKDIAQQNLERAGNGDKYEGWDPIASRAKDQFYSETIPSLAERFTALGNGPRSSNFAGTLGNAGAEFDSRMAALKSQYGQQQQALNSSEFQALLPFFQKQYDTPKNSFFDSAGQNILQAGGRLAEGYIGNYINRTFGNQPQINPLNPLQNQQKNTLGGGSNPT